jgi:Fe-Mn family superoxide dismutase
MAYKEYTPKDYSQLKGLVGITDEQILAHLDLYKGYVRRVNSMLKTLQELDPGSQAWQEERRRLGWEFNGMRLHEVYFDQLMKGSGGASGKQKITSVLSPVFKNFDEWVKELKSAAVIPGIGWVAGYLDKLTGQMITVWVNEHDQGHLAGLQLVFILDVFEHAYGRYLPFTERKKYVEDYFENVNWDIVAQRLG